MVDFEEIKVDFFLGYPNFRDTLWLEFRIYRATGFATSRKTSNLKYSRATFLDFDLWAEISVNFAKNRQNLNLAPKF